MTSFPHPRPTVTMHGHVPVLLGPPHRDPTASTAVHRASRRIDPLPASSAQLRTRLARAVAVDDGHGARLLAARIAKADG